jgi:hypothetical protein
MRTLFSVILIALVTIGPAVPVSPGAQYIYVPPLSVAESLWSNGQWVAMNLETSYYPEVVEDFFQPTKTSWPSPV